MSIDLLTRAEKGSPLSSTDYDNNLAAIQAAINAVIPGSYQVLSEKGVANGYAALGAGGLVPITQLASGTPDGTKFVRDDGALATVSGGAQTLTYAATTTWNVFSGQAATLTLTGNTTINAPTNIRAGETYALKIIQGGAGSYTVTWGAAFKWPGGTIPTLSTAVGAHDVLSFLTFDGARLEGVLQKAFA